MEQSELSDELRHEYNRMLHDLANVITNEQLPMLLGVLERIPDPADDLHTKFEENPGDLRYPKTWLDFIRLLRFSLMLKAPLSAQYDNFVQAYQVLSTTPNMGPDQTKLLGEIGDLMYNIDDLAGDHERLATKIITELSRDLKETYGMLMTPRHTLSSETVHEDHAFRLAPLIKDLLRLCDGMMKQLGVMKALLRMRRLIVGL